MASTYSTNLAIELIGTGDQAGTWGVTTNSNLGTLIEQAISGYVTQAVATGTDTTITIPNGATGVARNMYIELTGTGGTNTNLIVPSNKKLYFIFNNSTGDVTVKVTGQTGVSVPQGKKMILVSNGTDIVNGVNYIADFGTNSFTVTNLTASSATITNLIATTASISDASATVLRASSATLTHLSATSASITNLALTSLTISSLNITNVSVASATVSSNLVLSGGTANGVLYLNGSKVATSGSGLTYNGSTLATTGALTVDGNATLGNATTDAVTVSGYMGVGGAGSTSRAVNIVSTALTGTAQFGAWITPTNSAAGTSQLTSIYSSPVAANNVTTVRHYYADNATGAGTVTSQVGVDILDLTKGTTNIGVQSALSSGTNKWNIYASGTANNYFAGNVGIGTSSPSSKLHLSGAATADARLTFTQTTAGLSSQIQQGSTGMAISALGSQAMLLETNGTERMRIDSSGNVGIGTSSPRSGYRLDVQESANNGVNIQAGDASADIALSVGSASTADKFVIQSGGNVGIGTSSPGVPLDVVGRIKSSIAFVSADGSVSEPGYRFTNDADTGIYLPSVGVLGLVTGGTERSRITAGGDLLVGTTDTAPGVLDTNTGISLSSGGTIFAARNSDYVLNLSRNSTDGDIVRFRKDGTTVGSVASVATGKVGFYGSGGTGAVIDSSGNVGIGTASPATRLSVDNTRSDTAGTGWFTYTNAAVTTGRRGMRVDTNNGYWFDYYNGSTWSAQMGLDSSGNLGLGVTPSGWSSAVASQVGYGAALSSRSAGSTASDMTHGAYWNGTNWLYQHSSVGAGRYQMTGANAGSTHAWFVSAGGTAGNAISFTQAMTLSAAGGLTVGGTSDPGAGRILAEGSGASHYVASSKGGVTTTYLMTDANGANVQVDGSWPIRFTTNSTERARITAGGEFLLSGLTSSVGSYWLQIKNTGSSANGAYMENASGNDRGILVMKHDQAAGATTGAMVVFQNSSGSTVGSITSSNTATAYNLSSDRRLKENIASADDAGSLIDNIEVVKFDWKVGGHNRYGFIAQDLHVVAPEAVTAGDAGDEIEKVWGVDYSKLVPMLVKEIQSLRARVAQLEAK